MGILRNFILASIGCLGFLSTFVSVLQLAEFLSSQNIDLGKDGSQIRNLLLLLVFYVQHSGMRTAWWKSLFKDTPYAAAERSIYCIGTGAAIQLILKHWAPLSSTPLLVLPIHEESGMLWTFFFLLHSTLWLIIYGACLTMDLPEMIGIKQVYYEILGLPPPLSLKSGSAQRLYLHMRHPGAICFLLILWLHPVITFDRLLMAYLGTAYMWFGFQVDRDDYQYVVEQAERKLFAVKNSGGGA